MNIRITTLNDFLAQDDIEVDVEIIDLDPSTEIKCIDCGDIMDRIDLIRSNQNGYAFIDTAQNIPRHANKYWCETCLEEKIL